MPGVSRANRAVIGVFLLPRLRMGTVRMTTVGASQGELFRAQRPRRLRVLDTRLRGATFVEHRIKSLINPPESTGMGFWSINPYVGCEFGCTYCYARYAHRYVVERAHQAGQVSSAALARYRQSESWEVFEQQIFVKQRQAVLHALERELPRIHRRNHRGESHPIVIGTATDPYQPAEKTYAITQTVLERLADEYGLSIGLITKSPLIRRDLELLTQLHQRHRVTVYISLITTDVRIIRLFEARSPTPQVRLNTLRRLTTAGLNAGLIVAPVLPGITDTVPRIERLFEALQQAGGRFAHPSPLRLTPAMHEGFLPIVERHFPDLYPKYLRTYRGAGTVSRSYHEKVSRQFRAIAKAYDIPVEDPALERVGSSDGRWDGSADGHTTDRDPAGQFGLWD